MTTFNSGCGPRREMTDDEKDILRRWAEKDNELDAKI
jgi:hypothetical protein